MKILVLRTQATQVLQQNELQKIIMSQHISSIARSKILCNLYHKSSNFFYIYPNMKRSKKVGNFSQPAVHDKFLARRGMFLRKDFLKKSVNQINLTSVLPHPISRSLTNDINDQHCLVNIEWIQIVQNSFEGDPSGLSSPSSATGTYLPMYPISKWPSPWLFQEVEQIEGKKKSTSAFEGGGSQGVKN